MKIASSTATGRIVLTRAFVPFYNSRVTLYSPHINMNDLEVKVLFRSEPLTLIILLRNTQCVANLYELQHIQTNRRNLST